MSYSFTAYFNDSGITTTTIFAVTETMSYSGDYGDSALSRSGFSGQMRFTATPASGEQFYRWVYRLGSATGTAQYSYDNPFVYTAGQNIIIRAESETGGSGGDDAQWDVEADSLGIVSVVSETPVYLDSYVLARYSVRFESSGAASFSTSGAFDTEGYLSTSSSWDSDVGEPSNYIAHNDDSSGSNFNIVYAVSAGVTYYIWVRMYNPEDAGQLMLHITPPSTAPITDGGSGFYIWSGGEWLSGQPYIYNGTGWIMVSPCVYADGWMTTGL